MLNAIKTALAMALSASALLLGAFGGVGRQHAEESAPSFLIFASRIYFPELLALGFALLLYLLATRVTIVRTKLLHVLATAFKPTIAQRLSVPPRLRRRVRFTLVGTFLVSICSVLVAVGVVAKNLVDYSRYDLARQYRKQQLMRARLDEAKFDYTAALNDYDTFVALFPSREESNGLSRTIQRLRKQLSVARHIADRALRLHGQSGTTNAYTLLLASALALNPGDELVRGQLKRALDRYGELSKTAIAVHEACTHGEAAKASDLTDFFVWLGYPLQGVGLTGPTPTDNGPAACTVLRTQPFPFFTTLSKRTWRIAEIDQLLTLTEESQRLARQERYRRWATARDSDGERLIRSLSDDWTDDPGAVESGEAAPDGTDREHQDMRFQLRDTAFGPLVCIRTGTHNIAMVVRETAVEFHDDCLAGKEYNHQSEWTVRAKDENAWRVAVALRGALIRLNRDTQTLGSANHQAIQKYICNGIRVLSSDVPGIGDDGTQDAKAEAAICGRGGA